MDWKRKFAAIKALSPNAMLGMIGPGVWVVARSGMEIADGQLLVRYVGRGATPELAVVAHWRAFVESLAPAHHVHCRGRRVRWVGAQWMDIVP